MRHRGTPNASLTVRCQGGASVEGLRLEHTTNKFSKSQICCAGLPNPVHVRQIWQSTGAFRDLLKLDGSAIDAVPRWSLDPDVHPGSHVSIYQFLIKWHGGQRPAIQPFGGLRRQVDAAMAARTPKVIMPVGAMEGNTIFIDVEHPRNAGQVKTAGGDIAGCHVPGGTFMKCLEFTVRRGVGSTAQASARSEEHTSELQS